MGGRCATLNEHVISHFQGTKTHSGRGDGEVSKTAMRNIVNADDLKIDYQHADVTEV